MARDHGRIQCAIWNDEDFRARSADAQWAYKMLLTQQALTYAGVIDYRPGRFAALAKGMTAARVEKAIKQLEDARFIVVDRLTEELLVRSYVRHDGVMDRANMGKAVARAFAKVVSLDLRTAILTELSRLYEASPRAAGFVGFGDLDPDGMDRIRAMASTTALPIASREA